jgi:nucleotide-binding universal stress UspA family protein
MRLAQPGKRPPSQGEIAELASVHLNTYYEIEAGVLRHREPADLEQIANVLQMAAGERRLLFLRTIGQEPPPRPQDAENLDRYVEFISNHRSPVMIHDSFNTIVAVNEAMRRNLPNWAPGVNVVEYVLQDPRARAEMVNWYERWVMLMLRVLKTRAVLAEDPHLFEQYEKVRMAVGATEDEVVVGRHVDDDEVAEIIRPDGSIFRFRLAYHKPVIESGPSEYTLVSFEPAEPDSRPSHPLFAAGDTVKAPGYVQGRWRIPASERTS